MSADRDIYWSDMLVTVANRLVRSSAPERRDDAIVMMALTRRVLTPDMMEQAIREAPPVTTCMEAARMAGLVYGPSCSVEFWVADPTPEDPDRRPVVTASSRFLHTGCGMGETARMTADKMDRLMPRMACRLLLAGKAYMARLRALGGEDDGSVQERLRSCHVGPASGAR